MDDCLNRVLHAEARAPSSTYRLQMNGGFTFEDAAGSLDYLDRLGIGDVYCSPLFEARPGSMHGYDVTRHDRFNQELGGPEGFAKFLAALKSRSMGLLLDLVPNHMGVGNDSIWWQDVLENGHASKYADYFDIDWRPLKPALRDKLLLPILAEQYGVELENQHIQVTAKQGWPYIRYYDHLMPLSPRSLPILFPEVEDKAWGTPAEFRELLNRLPHIPPHESSDERLQHARRERLAQTRPLLLKELRKPEVEPVLQKAIDAINGVAGRPRSFDRLHRLLEVQPYRLALWRTSAEDINYRRFFDINDLVGLRMENPAVFKETHCLVRRLLASGDITGLRIDHCDGMFNPRQYLIWLQQLYLAAQCRGGEPVGETAPNGIERDIFDSLIDYDWSKSRGPVYAVVEKILEPREYIPGAWPVSGTSGYDFAYLVNAVFIRGENENRFDSLYNEILGHPMNAEEIIYRSKLQVMQTSLSSEIHVLTNLLSKIAAASRYARDFTDNILETVLRETIACFPVYRTYIDDRGEYSERDTAFIRYASARAKRLNPNIDRSAFDFLRETLLLRFAVPQKRRREPGAAHDPRILYFALKFQQLTGPVMAKGVEDTAFYVYNRFVSSNEVGGSLRSFGVSLDTFHQAAQERLKQSPDTMLATSTHDTKRSEDVRARLNVISEIPRDWSYAIHRWRRMNTRFKLTLADGRIAPDANEEYLFYQTIVGAWPWGAENENGVLRSFVERLQEYAKKALSEAKVNMSWINPDPEYVAAADAFLSAILGPEPKGGPTRFVRAMMDLMPRLRVHGAVNSLAQLTAKIASPGVPDFYQGMEMWQLTLVDPDNRRPIDYELRRRCLEEMLALEAREGAAAVCQEACQNLSDGRVKMWTTHRGLSLRRTLHDLFRRGEYLPLEAEGTCKEHVLAFERRWNGQRVIAAVPRFSQTLMQGRAALPLDGAWGNHRLILPDEGRFRNVFTDEALATGSDRDLRLSSVFASFPVALLLQT